MKELLKNLYKTLYKEDLVQVKTVTVEYCPPAPIVPKTNREKLSDESYRWLGKEPTPNDEVDDEVSCVFSLTTIVKKILPDFPIMDYTPDLAKYLQTDKRFKICGEFKEGSIVVAETKTGNGKVMGHTFITGKNGKMLSNNSETGLWLDKYDIPMMIDRYSRVGGLKMWIFDLL